VGAGGVNGTFGTMEIVRAKPIDAESLTAVAHAAKRHWGYPESWIHHWRDSLTITPDFVANNVVFVATIAEGAVGFGTLRFDRVAGWIDHLWVLPAAMGCGVGRRLSVTWKSRQGGTACEP
jgi:hypothetical protein